MNKTVELIRSNLSSKKYISIIFALWLSLNYCYLHFSIMKYHPNELMKFNVFLFYTILSYSLITIGYFLWMIWHNSERKISSKIVFSTLTIILIVSMTYWIKNTYEKLPAWEWDRQFLLLHGNCHVFESVWRGFDSLGNPITVKTNPDLAYFRWVLLCAYIPCIAIAVLFYWKKSTRLISNRSIINEIVKTAVILLFYGLTTNEFLAILGIPFICSLVMVQNKTIRCRKFSKILIYLFVIGTILTIIALCGPYDEVMRRRDIQGYDLLGLLLIVINILFYIAVFVGLLSFGITAVSKFKLKNPFSKGFKTGFAGSFIITICWLIYWLSV